MDNLREHAVSVIRKFYKKYIKNKQKSLKKSYKKLMNSKNKTMIYDKDILCGECNLNKAVLRCDECKETKFYCPKCWVDIHVFSLIYKQKTPKRRNHIYYEIFYEDSIICIDYKNCGECSINKGILACKECSSDICFYCPSCWVIIHV